MELINNWAEQKNKCWCCGTDKSVKYKTKVMIIDSLPILSDQLESEICLCNKCALLSAFSGEVK